MSASLLKWSEECGVVTLTLNRPESANALSRELLLSLQGAIRQLVERSDVVVVVITGSGEKAFSAGADLKERHGMNEAQVRRAVNLIRSTIAMVGRLPQPVIAALNGGAFGGGLELALACDLRVVVDTAKLGLTETSLAIIPGAGGTQRLPRLIGLAKAKELIYTARRIDAMTARELGLVNDVVAPERLKQRVQELVSEIASNGPVALRQAKFAVDSGWDVDLQTGLNIEAMAYEVVIPTEDRQEGLQAFAEKRKPRYKGK